MSFFGHGRSLSVSKEVSNHSKYSSSHLPEKNYGDTRLVEKYDQHVQGEYFLIVE